MITVSGTPVHLPARGRRDVPEASASRRQPAVLLGLLVLALSEVFRQGIALKNENDLTI